MSLFGKIVRTAINTTVLPFSVAKDVVTLGGVATQSGKSATLQQLQKIKDEAED